VPPLTDDFIALQRHGENLDLPRDDEPRGIGIGKWKQRHWHGM
jgi:hypothetical protein